VLFERRCTVCHERKTPAHDRGRERTSLDQEVVERGCS
jgi:hypothetical protein